MVISELLYIILFLHQTTTIIQMSCIPKCCISYYSYIKPQQLQIFGQVELSCISYYSYIKPQQIGTLSLFLLVVYRTIPTSNHNLLLLLTLPLLLYIVLFLHQTTTVTDNILLKNSCISYYSYIKPQLQSYCFDVALRCISYYSYIKPQLIEAPCFSLFVVYRTIPTSNHNLIGTLSLFLLLYIVLFLHQTTTGKSINSRRAELYIVLFLHQTTTSRMLLSFCPSCISYYSYIKPQPFEFSY